MDTRVEGDLVRENDRLTFRREALRLPLDNGAQAGRPGANGRIVLGVRPEAVTVSANLAEGIPARVYIQEPLGSDLFLTLETNGVLLKARTVPEFQVPTDSAVSFRLDSRKYHLFDAVSGEALRANS